MKIIWEISDSDGGSIRVVATPPIEDLLVKHSKTGNLTAAEGLAIYLTKCSLDYSQAQAEKSRIVVPDMAKPKLV